MSRMIGNIIEQYAKDTFNLIPLVWNSYADAVLMNIPTATSRRLAMPNRKYVTSTTITTAPLPAGRSSGPLTRCLKLNSPAGKN